MYKVVIVDDEPIIVEGLSKTIPWQKWGCKVVGTAEDGREGVGVIAKSKPDMVVTDIYMPGMDGLEMIAALRSEYPEMEVTILTGFRDFDYAQKAIGLGVTRFLLKPSKRDEIEEAIQAMIHNIDEKRRKKQLAESYYSIAGQEVLSKAVMESSSEILPEPKAEQASGGQAETTGKEAGWAKEIRSMPADSPQDTASEAMDKTQSEFSEGTTAAEITAAGKTVFSEKKSQETAAAVSEETSSVNDLPENLAEKEIVAGSFVVNNAIKFIEANYMEKIKLNDVAEHVYVSQWHLSKLLNRHTGQSFSGVLNQVRIEKAKELLKDPSLRIGDVADMVGFLDMAHFSRVFKKQTGLSAHVYRNGRI